MKIIKYKLADGNIVDVEVTEELADALAEMNRQDESHERKFKRRALRETSLDYLSEEFEWEPADNSVNVQDELERKEDSEWVRRAIACLDAQQQKIVRLYFYEGKTTREIAEILGIHHSTAARQIEEIKKEIKKYL